MSEPATLNYWPHAHPLMPEGCPCDIDFCDWIDENAISDRVIFHFGSGEHHILSHRNAGVRPPNHILAVTASTTEYDAYMRRVIGDAIVGNHYKVIFLDIYTLSPRLLPEFDVVTLFHLGEFYSEQNALYAPLDDAGLVDLFLSRLRPDGRILFYRGSWGAEIMQPIVRDVVASGRLVFEEDYKSLSVYRRP